MGSVMFVSHVQSSFFSDFGLLPPGNVFSRVCLSLCSKRVPMWLLPMMH